MAMDRQLGLMQRPTKTRRMLLKKTAQEKMLAIKGKSRNKKRAAITKRTRTMSQVTGANRAGIATTWP